MKKRVFLLSLVSLFSLHCMEEGEEITVDHKTEELEQKFVAFTSNMYQLTPFIYVGSIVAEDFVQTDHNRLWADLARLITLVEKRNDIKILEHLDRYKSNTQQQLKYFYDGIAILSRNDQTAAHFKENIKKKLTYKEQECFEDMFSKEPQNKPTDWLQMRITALNTLVKKLEHKTIQERIASTIEQAPTCAIGVGCGIAAMTLFTPEWFIGACGLLCSSGLFIVNPTQVCEDCRPGVICTNNQDISVNLKNTIRLLHLSESKILNYAAQNAESNERDLLLPKNQRPKNPDNGNGSINSI